jgi:hypothetical protein
VQSFERVVCGYDLHATRGKEELHVEVKGCVGSVPRFFISRTELGAARIDRHWRLAVVTTASRRPGSVKLLKHDEMDQLFDLEATHWVATRRLE